MQVEGKMERSRTMKVTQRNMSKLCLAIAFAWLAPQWLSGQDESPYMRIKINTWVTSLTAINDSGMVVGKCLAPPDYFYEYAMQLTPQIKGSTIQYPRADIKMFTEIVDNRPFNLNNKGQVVGQTRSPISRATLWLQDGKEVDLGVTPFGTPSHAYDINEAGMVVVKNLASGECFVVVPNDANGDRHADTWFLDTDGNEINDLLYPVAQDLTPCSINEAGQIVFSEGVLLSPENVNIEGAGNPWYSDKNGDGVNDRLHVLISLGGTTIAHDINEAGQIVGSSGGQAVMWEFTDGVETMTQLGLPTPQAENVTAIAINNTGQIVGTYSIKQGKRIEGFLFHAGTMHRLDNLMADNSVMRPSEIGINNKGWIIEHWPNVASAVAIPAEQLETITKRLVSNKGTQQ
jgi:uncharacterized membrane protein